MPGLELAQACKEFTKTVGELGRASVWEVSDRYREFGSALEHLIEGAESAVSRGVEGTGEEAEVWGVWE